MNTHKRSLCRLSRLNLDCLETRETPAGAMIAALSGGVLTLTGDDASNEITIRQVVNGVELTGTNSTTVNGQTSVTLNGTFSAITSAMKDGDDIVRIDAADAFNLTGNASFDLGDGNNTLSLLTLNTLTIGGNLAVKVGDGFDTVTVDGGASSQISGSASLVLGVGGSNVTFRNIALQGASGLSMTAGEGNDSLTLDTVQVTKAVTVVGGLGALTVSATDSTLGSLSLSANGKGLTDPTQSIDLDLTNTTVSGALKVKSNLGADVDVAGATLGSLSINGGILGVVDVDMTGVNSVSGNVAIRANDASLDVSGGTLTVTGNLQVNGSATASVSTGISGILTVNGQLSVQANQGDASLTANGISVTVEKNLTVSGFNGTNVVLATTALSEVSGQVFIRGGDDDDSFSANANFKADKNLSLNLGSGDNTVVLGDGSVALAIGGNLSITTRDGNDSVTLDDLTVAGATSISLGAGVDTLIIRNDSVFTGTVLIDLGAGADVLNIANVAGDTAVTFNGQVLMRTGSGNDTVNLGLVGDANAKVLFNAVRNALDAGPGLDGYVAANGQIAGALTVTNV